MSAFGLPRSHLRRFDPQIADRSMLWQCGLLLAVVCEPRSIRSVSRGGRLLISDTIPGDEFASPPASRRRRQGAVLQLRRRPYRWPKHSIRGKQRHSGKKEVQEAWSLRGVLLASCLSPLHDPPLHDTTPDMSTPGTGYDTGNDKELGAPPPAFSVYQPQFFETDDGDIISHDHHLNEDGEQRVSPIQRAHELIIY